MAEPDSRLSARDDSTSTEQQHPSGASIPNGEHGVPADHSKVVAFRDSGSTKPLATTIAAFQIGLLDGSGRLIEDIYFKRADYVIYCTSRKLDGGAEKQILIQYADNNDNANAQIAEVAELIPLRNRLQFLLREINQKDRYFMQIAEAFRLGLEHKIEVAKATLTGAIEEVQTILGASGRNLYIKQAGPYAVMAAAALMILSAVLLYFAGANFKSAMSSQAHLLIAAGAGAVGALLSIAISVRARTVATDGDQVSIASDSLLRVLIGVISAGVLYLILNTGALSLLKIGDMTFKANAISWQLSLLAGFAAGFLERLVPDMLEKAKK